MKGGLKRFWPGPWGWLIMLPFYVVVLIGVAPGHDWERGLHPGIFLLWIPLWVAWGTEYESGGFLPTNARPDRPDGRAAVAGVSHALANAGFMAWILASAPLGDGRDPGSAMFGLVVIVTVTLLIVAVIPRPANWVRVWNGEQAQRLIAAEDALATARTRVLQSQMQPHFLFNALNSVTALLREDPMRAKAVLLSLRGLMERSLATAQQPTTTVREEVAFVRDQLAIERERFHDRLTVRFDVDEQTLDDAIPAFSVQPLAENALRHGIARSIDGGEVEVRVSRDGSDLVLAVENTGAGLPPRWREGMGLGNLRERLRAAYGAKASLSVEQHGNRTIATIRIQPRRPQDPRTPGLLDPEPLGGISSSNPPEGLYR